MAAMRCSPRACRGKRLIVVGLVTCSTSSTGLSVMDSRFNECWYTFHVSYSASCLDENRGKVHVSNIRAFPRFVKRRGNIRLWEVLRFTHDHPWCKYPFSTAPCQLKPFHPPFGGRRRDMCDPRHK